MCNVYGRHCGVPHKHYTHSCSSTNVFALYQTNLATLFELAKKNNSSNHKISPYNRTYTLCCFSLCPPQVRLQMLSLPLWSSPTPQREMCVSKSRRPHLADTVCARTVASLTLEPPLMFLVCKRFFHLMATQAIHLIWFKDTLWFSHRIHIAGSSWYIMIIYHLFGIVL